jgi:hypothetical protein
MRRSRVAGRVVERPRSLRGQSRLLASGFLNRMLKRTAPFFFRDAPLAAGRHAVVPLLGAGNRWAGGNKPRIHNPFGQRLRLIAGLGVLSCCDRIPHFFSKVHLPPVSLTNWSDLRYSFAEPDSLRYASQYVVLHSLTISVTLLSRVPRPPPKEK